MSKQTEVDKYIERLEGDKKRLLEACRAVVSCPPMPVVDQRDGKSRPSGRRVDVETLDKIYKAMARALGT